LQEIVTRGKLRGRVAHLFTMATSLVIATIATWATGGFAELNLPPITFAAPSPLFTYLFAYWAPLYGLSQVAYGLFGGSRAADGEWSPGLVQAVARTTAPDAPAPMTPLGNT